MNRRSFLGGLLVGLAAPAIIRTPGLLMAVKPIAMDNFSTDNLLVHATERYSSFLVSGFDQFNNPVTERLVMDNARPEELREESLVIALAQIRYQRIRLRPTHLLRGATVST